MIVCYHITDNGVVKFPTDIFRNIYFFYEVPICPSSITLKRVLNTIEMHEGANDVLMMGIKNYRYEYCTPFLVIIQGK